MYKVQERNQNVFSMHSNISRYISFWVQRSTETMVSGSGLTKFQKKKKKVNTLFASSTEDGHSFLEKAHLHVKARRVSFFHALFLNKGKKRFRSSHPGWRMEKQQISLRVNLFVLMTEHRFYKTGIIEA